jgi:ribosomal protein S18 acetylase RimI-like enzyme
VIVTLDAWFSERFGMDAWRVEADAEGPPLPVVPGPAFYYAKVDVADIPSMSRLARDGFVVVDVNVDYLYRSSWHAAPPKSAIHGAGGRAGASVLGGDRMSQIAEGTACPPGAAPPKSAIHGAGGTACPPGAAPPKSAIHGAGGTACPPGAAPPPLLANFAIRPMIAGEAEAILEIAGTTFRYSRFHLDPEVPDRVANEIKREWMRSYVEGRRGKTTLVALDGDEVVGFLAVIASMRGDESVRRIDLIGVKRGRERQGVGRALVADFIRRYAADHPRLEVGTQVANVPSIRLYESLGFRLDSAAYVLHKHLPARTD